MRRRDFIAGLMIAAVTGRAQAQQTGKVYRIALAHPTAPVADQNQASKSSFVIPAMLEELTRFGYVEGRNLLIERYSGEGRAAHYPELGFSIVGPPLEWPTDEQAYHRVFAALAQEGAEGLVVSDAAENVTYRRLIIELAAKGRLPTIYPYRQFVEAGGLMSYGIDLSDVGHRVAYLVDKILKGAKPGEIPIFQPTKFELSINLKTAKTLGIELPPSLVGLADNVIE